MEETQVIRLNDGDCIHVIRKEHPQQIGLVRGPALVVVIEEAAAVTTASDEAKPLVYGQSNWGDGSKWT